MSAATAPIETGTTTGPYHHLFNAAPVGFLTLNREGVVSEANAALCRLAGRHHNDIVKHPFGPLVAAEDHDTWMHFLKRMIHSDHRERCTLILQPPEGHRVTVIIEGVMDAKNEIALLTVTDITWYKHHEEDRLIRDKLASTRMLAGGMAHDFNNLLSIILLNIDLTRTLLARGQEMEEMLNQADTAVGQAARLMKRIQQFSDGVMPVYQRVRLNDLFRTCAELLLVDTPVSLTCDLAQDLWPARVDTNQIEMAIRHVIMNAKEAMPKGGTLRIESRNEPHPNHDRPSLPDLPHIRLSVIDEGPGITREHMTKVFDPYFSTKPRGTQKGMGIGLTICHTVLSRHQGAIFISSEPGQGTAIHLYLPATSMEPPLDEKPTTSTSQESLTCMHDSN